VKHKILSVLTVLKV